MQDRTSSDHIICVLLLVVARINMIILEYYIRYYCVLDSFEQQTAVITRNPMPNKVAENRRILRTMGSVCGWHGEASKCMCVHFLILRGHFVEIPNPRDECQFHRFGGATTLLLYSSHVTWSYDAGFEGRCDLSTVTCDVQKGQNIRK